MELLSKIEFQWVFWPKTVIPLLNKNDLKHIFKVTGTLWPLDVQNVIEAKLTISCLVSLKDDSGEKFACTGNGIYDLSIKKNESLEPSQIESYIFRTGSLFVESFNERMKLVSPPAIKPELTYSNELAETESKETISRWYTAKTNGWK